MRTLAHGTGGNDVTTWQAFLISQGILEAGGADGRFGPKTEKATKDYQAKHGLEADGIVGPKTIAAAVAEGFVVPAIQIEPAVPVDELHPVLAQRVAELINRTAQQNNIASMVHDGFRSFAEQTALFNQGRTTPGPIVTNAQAGESYHNYGLAVDVVTNQNGKPAWLEHDALLRGPIGQGLKLEWGGAWKDFKDLPHFQLTMGLKVRDCLAIYNQNGHSIKAVWDEIDRRLSTRDAFTPGDEVE
jgi:hypothetical protein